MESGMRTFEAQGRTSLVLVVAFAGLVLLSHPLRAGDIVNLMWEDQEPEPARAVQPTSTSADKLQSGSVQSDLSDLRARLDAVEQQNRALSQRLQSAAAGTAGVADALSSRTIQPTAYDAYSSNATDYSATNFALAPDGAAPCYECAPPDPLSMTAKWNYGLELQSADKKFRVHLGGRWQFDGVWFDDSPAFNGTGGAEDADGVAFRRARLRIDGTMYEIIDWAAEYDFANSTNDNAGLQPASEANVTAVTAITDLYVNISHIPYLGNFRIGHFKEPIGMEHLTSSRFLEFMERSFNQDVFTGAFNNGFSPGMMLWNTYADEHGVWATGFFKNTTNVFGYDVGDGEYAWSSRVTTLPWYEDEGARLLHFGASGSLRDPNNDLVRYRTRPSLRNGPGALNPILADTGNFGADGVAMMGGEAAMNLGPLNFQGEFYGALNDNSINGVGNNVGDVFVHGWYCEALYFLTGEHRDYDRKAGVFTRVVPHRNFHWHGGCGAWQIGARYSSLDLRDDGIDGGVIHDVTLGLNWFLNPNLKMQWNYVVTERDAPTATDDGTIHGFGMRVAHDF
jgi:phosphate-selective porin OprO/OprP